MTVFDARQRSLWKGRRRLDEASNQLAAGVVQLHEPQAHPAQLDTHHLGAADQGHRAVVELELKRDLRADVEQLVAGDEHPGPAHVHQLSLNRGSGSRRGADHRDGDLRPRGPFDERTRLVGGEGRPGATRSGRLRAAIVDHRDEYSTSLSDRIVLVMHTTSYGAAGFADACRRAGAHVAVASDRCHVLNRAWHWPDDAIVIDFMDPDAAGAAVADEARRAGPVAAVLPVGGELRPASPPRRRGTWASTRTPPTR